MDWRRRRYYTVRLPSYQYNRYKDLIKESLGVKLHPTTYPRSETPVVGKFDDELKDRGYYHFLVSVPKDYSVKNLMYLFNSMCRECAENGWIFKWEEVLPNEKE